MWLIVMFDLPTDTVIARKSYAIFRKQLLINGFIMMQYSIYMRHCTSEENATVHLNRIKSTLPENGEVRIFFLTDKQFSRMKIFYGKIRKAIESVTKQISLF